MAGRQRVRIGESLPCLTSRSAATDVISFTMEATRKIVSRVIAGHPIYNDDNAMANLILELSDLQ